MEGSRFYPTNQGAVFQIRAKFLESCDFLWPAALPPVGAWRRPHQLAEDGGEVALGGKAQPLAHVRDPAPGVGQEVFGTLHPLVEQILMRAQPGALLEEPAEVVGAHLRHASELREAQVVRQVFLHVREQVPQARLGQTAMIGLERGWADRIVLHQVDR
jgi:hypothetical protein